MFSLLSTLSYPSTRLEKSLAAAGDQSAALRTAVLKRSYAYSGAGGLDAASAALTERIMV